MWRWSMNEWMDGYEKDEIPCMLRTLQSSNAMQCYGSWLSSYLITSLSILGDMYIYCTFLYWTKWCKWAWAAVPAFISHACVLVLVFTTPSFSLFLGQFSHLSSKFTYLVSLPDFRSAHRLSFPLGSLLPFKVFSFPTPSTRSIVRESE